MMVMMMIIDAQSEMMRQLRADAAGQKFTDDSGRLKQIFPPRDRSLLDIYMKLLETSCSLYEPSLETEQKHEVQRFLVRKVCKQNTHVKLVIRFKKNTHYQMLSGSFIVLLFTQ